MSEILGWARGAIRTLLLLSLLQLWVYLSHDIVASPTDRLTWLGVNLITFDEELPGSFEALREAVVGALRPTGTGLDTSVNVRRIPLSILKAVTEDLNALFPKRDGTVASPGLSPGVRGVCPTRIAWPLGAS